MTDELDTNEPLQFKLPEPKLSQPKMNVAKAKEELKKAQEAVRKAQEEQKRVKEIVKKTKESTWEPGICDHIKAVNTEANADSERPNPPHLSQMARARKSSTHRGKDVAIPEPDRNWMIKKHHDFLDIYDFGTDEEELDHNNTGLGKSRKESGGLVNDGEKKGKGKVGMQQQVSCGVMLPTDAS